jgi:hypothetical protein
MGVETLSSRNPSKPCRCRSALLLAGNNFPLPRSTRERKERHPSSLCKGDAAAATSLSRRQQWARARWAGAPPPPPPSPVPLPPCPPPHPLPAPFFLAMVRQAVVAALSLPTAAPTPTSIQLIQVSSYSSSSSFSSLLAKLSTCSCACPILDLPGVLLGTACLIFPFDVGLSSGVMCDTLIEITYCRKTAEYSWK